MSVCSVLIYPLKDSEGAFMSSSNLGLGLSATPLAEFLVHRAILNPKLGNFLYWYLVVEAPEPGKIKPYSRSYDNTLAVYKEELSKVLCQFKPSIQMSFLS
jgi:hypothetical protein